MDTRHHIALVRLNNPGLGIVTPPLGIGYLLKSLRQMKEINPLFIDCHLHDLHADELVTRLTALKPFLIGFQVYSIDYLQFSTILPKLRAALPDTVLIAGGPHVTALPDLTLNENPALDYVICGEGEIALPMLIRHILYNERPLASICNLAYRVPGKTTRTKNEWINVDDFGAPAWDAIAPQNYPPVQHGTFHKSTKVVPIITSRGCPYPCTFCAGSLMTGTTIRVRSIASVVDEIEALQNEYGFEEFIIEDENFTFYRERVIEFADEILKRRITCYFSFPNGIRLDRLDEETVLKLKAIGTYMVALGIESISPNTLRRMNKDWSREQVISQIAVLKRHGIIVQANFILGFRDDTLEDIGESVAFANQLDVDQIYFSNYIPLPGTPDFDILLESGEIELSGIDWNKYSGFHGKYPYHPKDVPVDILRSLIRKATLGFYSRPGVMFNFLKRMTHPVYIRSLFFRVSRLFFHR
jgi:anaerobic magnesium-protoporphyrin IX monomethyl ester cyclase